MLMVFESALQGMRFGHKLRCRSWPAGNYYHFTDGALYIHIEGCEDRTISSIDAKDILSTDWEIV